MKRDDRGWLRARSRTFRTVLGVVMTWLMVLGCENEGTEQGPLPQAHKSRTLSAKGAENAASLWRLEEKQSGSNWHGPILTVDTSLLSFTAPREAFDAAAAAVPELVSMLLAPIFHEPVDLERVLLGAPYKEQFASQLQEDRTATAQNESWLFPVLVDGEAVSLLRMQFVEDRWVPAAAGMGRTARMLAQVEAQEGAFSKDVRRVMLHGAYEDLQVAGVVESSLPLEQARFYTPQQGVRPGSAPKVRAMDTNEVTGLLLSSQPRVFSTRLKAQEGGAR